MFQKYNLILKSRITISILFFFSFQLMNAQISNISNMKNWELMGYGKDAERVNDIYSSIDYYSEYIKRKTDNMKVSYKLAKMYFDVNDFAKAKVLFNKVLEKSLKKYPNSLYYYAEILRIESKYDSAISDFTRYQELLNKHKRKGLLFYMADVKIESCLYAANNSRLKKNYLIKHLNTTINKAHMESAPLIIDDSVFVYSSLVADSVPIIGTNNRSPHPYHKFYKAKLINNEWRGGYPVSKPFFDFENLNASNGAFSEDKKRFYFTLSHKNKLNKTISAIHVSHLKNNKWSKPIKLGQNVNMKGYTSTQPTICNFLKDYEVVYFVSDRPGGWGNFDIWYTVYNKQTETYNKPVNAGGYLNSAGADITPYYDAETKTMYFSTDGLAGYGGFDIFRTNGALVEWLPPENFGLPINSNYNDIYYKKQKNKEKGFLISNRDESIDLKNPNCCYDVFEYTLPQRLDIKINGIVSKKRVNVLDEIYNKISNDTILEKGITELMENKKVQLWMLSKVSGISVLLKTSITDVKGSYNFENIEKNRKYIIRVDDKTLLRKELYFDTDKLLSDTVIQLDTFFIEPIPKKPIVFEKIYFEFGNAELTGESKKTIDNTLLKILETQAEIVVEIGAHTDYLGKRDYNLKLSQKRAESVVNYLIKKGIHESRLKPVGYGEKMPLVPSQTDDGKDIPEAREKNRRIEFTIIGTIRHN